MLRVQEYVNITDYSGMGNEVLLQEARDLRDSIDHPKLTKRHYVAATLLTTIGPGSTLAALVGYSDYLIHLKELADSKATEPLSVRKDYTGKLRGVFENWRNLGDYFDNPNNRGFKNNLMWTLGTFIVTSIAFFPLFLRWQRQRRAEESAIKLSHVERILEERGYERSVATYSSYTPSWMQEEAEKSGKKLTYTPSQKPGITPKESFTKKLEEEQTAPVAAAIGA